MIPQLLRITQTTRNNLKQLVVKMIGAKATYTAEQYAPHGVDSRPPNGMTAIYMKTTADGDECVIGYLTRDGLAAVGENRLFSTDENGALKSWCWLKNDGTIELNGNENFAVKFNELKAEFNKLKASYNNLVSIFNSHVHPGVTTGGGSTTPTPTPAAANTSNIDLSKNEKIKTNN
jgi:hypothetical protein